MLNTKNRYKLNKGLTDRLKKSAYQKESKVLNQVFR